MATTAVRQTGKVRPVARVGRPRTGESPELLHRNALWWWMVNTVGLSVETVAAQQGYTPKTVAAGIRFTSQVIEAKAASSRVLAEALGLAEMLGMDNLLTCGRDAG